MSFNRDILPILAGKCFACHGVDQAKREGDLRLDEKSSAYMERDGVRALCRATRRPANWWLEFFRPTSMVMPPRG